MEKERGVAQREGGSAVNTHTPADDDGRGALYQAVAADDDAVGEQGIPGVGPECDVLLDAALEGEEQLVFHELGRQLLRRRGRQLDKHADAVALAHFEACDH